MFLYNFTASVMYLVGRDNNHFLAGLQLVQVLHVELRQLRVREGPLPCPPLQDHVDLVHCLQRRPLHHMERDLCVLADPCLPPIDVFAGAHDEGEGGG